jgi:hypothetical protein
VEKVVKKDFYNRVAIPSNPKKIEKKPNPSIFYGDIFYHFINFQ